MFVINSQPSIVSSLTKVVILQATGPFREQGFPHLWINIWHFWGHTKRGFEEVGKTLTLFRVPYNKQSEDGTVPSNKELVNGTVPSNKELVRELFRPIASSIK